MENFQSAYNIKSGMNLASSLVESYMYADMFNREYDGGSNMQERIYAAGLPVNNIVSSVGDVQNKYDTEKQDGGVKTGPFSNKVVPAGLVIINRREYSNAEYENHFHPGVQREVVPDQLYEMLIMSVVRSPKRRITPTKSRDKNRKSSSRKIQMNRHKEKLRSE